MHRLSHLFEKRLQELLSTVPKKLLDYSQPEATPGELAGWLMSGASLLRVVVGKQLGHPYSSIISMASVYAGSDQAYHGARTMHGVLSQLKADFESGLLSDLDAQAAVRTFNDMLDHAQAYLRQRRKEPAGVLTGVVFEDTIRKLCRRYNIAEAEVKLHLLLNELVNKNILLPIDRGEGTTVLSVRNSASHARWHEFGEENVKSALDFTRRLIREKLAGS